MARLLVVGDKKEIEAVLKRRFSRNKMRVDAVRGVDAVLDQFGQRTYDLVIWDADVSGTDKSKGFELL